MKNNPKEGYIKPSGQRTLSLMECLSKNQNSYPKNKGFTIIPIGHIRRETKLNSIMIGLELVRNESLGLIEYSMQMIPPKVIYKIAQKNS